MSCSTHETNALDGTPDPQKRQLPMYTPGQHAPKYFDMQDMENRGFQSYWIGRAMQVAEQQKNALAERLGAGALVFSLEYQAQLESDMQRIDSTIQDYAKIIDPSLEK